MTSGCTGGSPCFHLQYFNIPIVKDLDYSMMKDWYHNCKSDSNDVLKCIKDQWEKIPILFHLNLEIIERINDDGVETEVVSVII